MPARSEKSLASLEASRAPEPGMDSGPDETIFLFGVFGVFDNAEPSRRAPQECTRSASLL